MLTRLRVLKLFEPLPRTLISVIRTPLYPNVEHVKTNRRLRRKSKATLILKTGRFDYMDSAAIISSVSLAVQN